ncbi:MAG: hypothetical protein M1838_000772 [Thelocarpon superellum]|nr:MAG: hypothetical protein M1838_000772 [Thelocarpon superellum]
MSIVPALHLPDNEYLTTPEREEVLREEYNLMRDDHVLPPSDSNTVDENMGAVEGFLRRYLSTSPPPITADDPPDGSAVQADEPSETTALLPDRLSSRTSGATSLAGEESWEAAVLSGKIQTTWRRETQILVRYSRPLVVTFLLHYSLLIAGIVAVGHLGTMELGAASLANMTANITGYAVYQGLATSLDTLCAQAYGSGRKDLVGLQMQRMIYFLWLATIPIAALWLCSAAILRRIIPDPALADLAGLSLRILVLGAPGYAAFEAGKRFLQAQGLFSATLYVLLVCAPLNAFLSWLFVWKFQWGFVGAPIAIVVTENLLPLGLLLYVVVVGGRECWPGFTWRAMNNWGPMIRLALPGLLMVEAEWLAFEILTLAASYFSNTHLAAQSIISNVLALMYMVPFPISIAASTRIANLIGAALSNAAKTSIRVSLVASGIVGLLNASLLFLLRSYIPRLYTNDPAVIALVARILPIGATFQLFDALAACCNGVLRGLGRQSIGGWVNLFAYYAIAMPISFGTGFGLHWELAGLWTGPAIALAVVATVEGWFIYRTKGEEVVEEARKRNLLL